MLPSPPRPRSYDAIVVGGGPTGLAAAIALAKAGFTVALADGHATRHAERPAPTNLAPTHSASIQTAPAGPANTERRDHRTAALFPASLCFLRNISALIEPLEAVSADLSAIRIVDSTGGLLRAPEVLFHARDLGLARLALNIPNSELAAALEAASRPMGIDRLALGPVTGIEMASGGCTLSFAENITVDAQFIVGADGRHSICRRSANIDYKTWTYEQSAVVTTFAHSRPHRGISTEVHGPAGPCTTVPLPGNRSSLVCVERPAEADRLATLSDTAFQAALSERLGGLLGEICSTSPRQRFPLSALLADTMARGRIALVGEAGHALPPIGAQGLNLGLADVAVLADELATWKTGWKAGGTGSIEDALGRYAARRAGDVARRAHAVDMLNRTLETGSTALHLLRGAGLHLLAGAPALRRLLMAQGLEPPHPLPALMQPTAASTAPTVAT